MAIRGVDEIFLIVNAEIIDFKIYRGGVMGRKLSDMSAWLADSGVKSQDEYMFLYKRVKARRNIYLLVFFGLPLIGSGIEALGGTDASSVFWLLSVIFITPFLFKASYLTKAFKAMDLSVEPNKLLSLLSGLTWIFVIPFVLLIIINHTNWGMGLRNWGVAYEKAKKKASLKELNK